MTRHGPSEPSLAAILRLQAWLSPAFPTGAFAYSHGLEWAVEAGDVGDGGSLRDWLTDILRHGGGRTDAILLRHAHAHAHAGAQAGAQAGADDIADLARAVQPSRERKLEAQSQGAAFAAAAAAWARDERLPDAPHAVAVGVLAGRHGIGADLACAAFLQAFAANLISAAVRLVPLGQSTGLAVLAALEPVILEVAAATRDAGLDDIGGCTWRADLAAMRHETQYTRLFRS